MYLYSPYGPYGARTETQCLYNGALQLFLQYKGIYGGGIAPRILNLYAVHIYICIYTRFSQ